MNLKTASLAYLRDEERRLVTLIERAQNRAMCYPAEKPELDARADKDAATLALVRIGIKRWENE